MAVYSKNQAEAMFDHAEIRAARKHVFSGVQSPFRFGRYAKAMRFVKREHTRAVRRTKRNMIMDGIKEHDDMDRIHREMFCADIADQVEGILARLEARIQRLSKLQGDMLWSGQVVMEYDYREREEYITGNTNNIKLFTFLDGQIYNFEQKLWALEVVKRHYTF